MEPGISRLILPAGRESSVGPEDPEELRCLDTSRYSCHCPASLSLGLSLAPGCGCLIVTRAITRARAHLPAQIGLTCKIVRLPSLDAVEF